MGGIINEMGGGGRIYFPYFECDSKKFGLSFVIWFSLYSPNNFP